MSFWGQQVNRLTLPDSFANLPSSVAKIQKLYAQESINAAMLVELLEKEPLLSANILKLVNSVHYGLSRKVTSVNHAVILLGATIVRGIVLASVLRKSFAIDLTPYAISIDDFDKICILRTKVLALWMKEENFDLPTLSSAAFLMESGKIIMANEILKSNSLERFHHFISESSVLEAEKELFELSSFGASAKLFKEWLFSEDFTELIAGVENPQTPEQRVLEVLVMLINTQEIISQNSINKALALVEAYGFNSEKFLEAVEKVKNQLLVAV